MTANWTRDSDWQVEVDQCTADQWSQMLDLFNDANFYQSWAYGAVRWGAKNLSHLVLKNRGEVVAMAQLRIVCPTRLRFGMAYLRWGPLCDRRGGSFDEEIVARASDALEAEYVERRKLFLRILPNAFLGLPRADVFRKALSKFVPEPASAENIYRTFLLDLEPGLDDLRKRLDKKWRNQLTRAEKNTLAVVADNSVEAFREFCVIYHEMRKRKGFETTVDVAEFERIQEQLPERHRMRVLICQEGGVPVAGMVATAMGDSAIYLLGATSDKGLNAKGSYLLQWTMIQWFKQNRIRWYDLGGIDPDGNPGVYSFKKGFSGEDLVQMSPMVACTNVVSSTVVRAGLAIQRAFRGKAEVTAAPSNG